MSAWTQWVPPDGVCVCGRDLPDECPSDWACSEPCQAAWVAHRCDPEYPHPRDIRDAAEARAAAIRRPAVPDRGVAGVADGTEIDVDGNRYVRVGACWQPAGMWTPLQSELADAVVYERWCLSCRRRRASHIEGDPRSQVCDRCRHRWPGLPLTGVVEVRGGAWPGTRLRLTDGVLSTTITFAERDVAASSDAIAARMRRCWLRLERRLGGGYADVDEPNERQRASACLQRIRRWAGVPDAVHMDRS